MLYCVCVLLSTHLLSNQTPLHSLLQWSESLQLFLSNPIKWVLIERILGVYYGHTKKLHKLTLIHKKSGLFYKQNKPKLMNFWDIEMSKFLTFTKFTSTHIKLFTKNPTLLNTTALIQYPTWKKWLSLFFKSHSKFLSYTETIHRQLISFLSNTSVCLQTQILLSWLYGKSENYTFIENGTKKL